MRSNSDFEKAIIRSQIARFSGSPRCNLASSSRALWRTKIDYQPLGLLHDSKKQMLAPDRLAENLHDRKRFESEIQKTGPCNFGLFAPFRYIQFLSNISGELPRIKTGFLCQPNERI